MELENRLIGYVTDTRFEDIPQKPLGVVKNIILGIFGSIAAGAYSKECVKLIGLLQEQGGKPESTVLLHGIKFPAHCAALANGTMAQSLDYDDAIVPGVHIGAVAVPAALAAAELGRGCSGRDFLTSLTAGIEFANRLNTINSSSFYGGFHGTGVCAVFAASVAAAKILGLDPLQTRDAVGLTLNVAGGSGQNNVEGVEAVSLVAGFASQGGLFCAQLAQQGISGLKEFLEGVKGWVSMFGTGQVNKELLAGDMGIRYELNKTVFKKFPSCGLTQTSTQGILELISENALGVDDVTEINVTVGPFAKTVVGHFEIGRNPTMNAQFSIPFCIANALIKGSSELRHFEEDQVRNPEIARIAKLVHVTSDHDVEKRDQRAMEMEVCTKGGRTYQKRIDVPRGSPGNEMTQDEHIARFRQCASYCKKPLPQENVERIISVVGSLESLNDVRDLVQLMLP